MIYTKKQVLALIGCSKETLRRHVAGGFFPQPISLTPGPNPAWCRKGWLKSEVEAWLADRAEARKLGPNEREVETGRKAARASHAPT